MLRRGAQRAVRTAAGIQLALACATLRHATGQAQPLEGQRTRISVTNRTPSRFIGTLLQVRSDSIVVQAEQQQIIIPRSQVTRVEVSRGQRSALGKGALIGALSGLLGGLVAGSVACASYDIAEGTCLNSNDGGQVAFFAPVGLGLLGGLGIGSLIGLASHTERWEIRPLPEQHVGLVIRALPGRRLGLGIRW